MATFKLQIITPERVFYNGDVEKVVLRGSEGDMAILQNHTPLTTTLSMGELKIFTSKKKYTSATLINGFAKIEPNEAIILSDAAEWPEEIDVKRAEASKERAEKRLKESDMDNTRAIAALRRAMIRLDVSKTIENK
ncbi:MAG: ATP synthase F1 subunit epsilon [Eubacteriaceae bacterium]